MFSLISLSKIQSFELIAQLAQKLWSPLIIKSEHKLIDYVYKQKKEYSQFLGN